MLSYKEYRRLKQSGSSKKSLVFEDIDDLFNSWTSEVAGLIVSPKYAENVINFCERSANSGSKWKTIQEHRMIKHLPILVREALEEECAQARLFINEAKYQVKTILKEAEFDPWAQLQNRNSQVANDIENQVAAIFQQLKTDLIDQYGTNRGVTPPSGGRVPQKPGLFGRAKNWLKSVWQGATGGDQNLRKFALSKGYAADPRYQQDPHAWKDPKKHPEFFPRESEFEELANLLKEDFEEAKITLDNVFAKHKVALLKLIAKYVLQTFGSPEPANRTTSSPESLPPSPESPKPEEDEDEINVDATNAGDTKTKKEGTPFKKVFSIKDFVDNKETQNELKDAIKNTKDGWVTLRGYDVKEGDRTDQRIRLFNKDKTIRMDIKIGMWKRATKATKAAETPVEAPPEAQTPPEKTSVVVPPKPPSETEKTSASVNVTDDEHIRGGSDNKIGDEDDDAIEDDGSEDNRTHDTQDIDQVTGNPDKEYDDATDEILKLIDKDSDFINKHPDAWVDPVAFLKKYDTASEPDDADTDDTAPDDADTTVVPEKEKEVGRKLHNLTSEDVKKIVDDGEAIHKDDFSVTNMKRVEKDEEGNLTFAFDRGVHPIIFRKIGNELFAFYDKQKNKKQPKYFYKFADFDDYEKHIVKRLKLKSFSSEKPVVKTSFEKPREEEEEEADQSHTVSKDTIRKNRAALEGW